MNLNTKQEKLNFVKLGYEFLLDRPIDEVGLNNWTENINHGVFDRIDFIQSILTSEEFSIINSKSLNLMKVKAVKQTLRGTDIIMPFRGGTPERIENLYAVLQYFDATFVDYRVLLIEADSESRFQHQLLNDPKVVHTFICDNSAFSRGLLCNVGVKLSHSQVVVISDVDCIVAPSDLSQAIQSILEHPDGGDILCPFYNLYDVSGEVRRDFMRSNDIATLQKNIIDVDGLEQSLNHGNVIHIPTPVIAKGGINVIERKLFIKYGGFDASMRGWGYEDIEWFYRSERLGLRWVHLSKGPMFHLNHDSTNRLHLEIMTQNELEKNPDFVRNSRLAFASRDMPIEKLQKRANELRQFFE